MSTAHEAIESNGNGHFEQAPHDKPYGADFRAVERSAQAFYTEGLDLYDEMVIGERSAKVMYLALLAMGGENGMAGIVIGEPGGGKSVMVENGHTIVGDIKPEHVAWVPHRQDLTPAELVGKMSEMKRSGERDGQPFSESFTGKVVPIPRPGIKVVQLDEITRTSPLAMNASLKILQDGKVEVMDGEQAIELGGFDLIASSTNNHGTLFTNRLDPAVVSRHAMGAFMGERQNGELGEAGDTIWENPHEIYKSKPAPGAAITLDALHKVRGAIRHIPIDRNEREFGKRLQTSMLDSMAEHGVNQAAGRLASQLVRISQTLALLRAGKEVKEEDIRDAVKYSLTARLGLAGKSPTEIDQINSKLG